MSWIEKNPDATHVERIKALAQSLRDTASDPNEFQLEYFGLPLDWNITDEPLETCQAFDALVMRCEACDWWYNPVHGGDSVCKECIAERRKEEE
jgi:hypothetical protein